MSHVIAATVRPGTIRCVFFEEVNLWFSEPADCSVKHINSQLLAEEMTKFMGYLPIISSSTIATKSMRKQYQDNEKQNPLQKILSKGSFYTGQRNNARNQIWPLLFTGKRGGGLTFLVISDSVVKDMARVVNGKGKNSNNNHTAASTCQPLPGWNGIGDADQDSKTIKRISWRCRWLFQPPPSSTTR
jgi:hypothetical protein